MALTSDTSLSTYEPLPADSYVLRLMDIEEKAGQFGPYWLWKFELDMEHADTPELPPLEGGREWKTLQWLFTSNRTNPGVQFKNRTKSPRLAAEALLGRKLQPGEFIEGDDYLDLIDRRCRATITEVTVDGVTRNEIASLIPLRGQRASIPPPTVQEPLFPGDDGDDIPFNVEPEPEAAGKGKGVTK